MDFDQITVKDSPGLCRCCLSEGCYKDLAAEYNWMGDNEVYADMLLECFDIGISQHMDGPNGPSRLICEVCITRLRDACNFKKQVVASEKKFIDMLGRGEFQSKVMVYEADMKVEPPLDLQTEDGDDGIEYLEEIDFDDDEPLKNLASTSKSAEISPTKRGRGRPKKSEGVPEKKPKTSKDDQKKVSKNKTIVKDNNGDNDDCESKYIARIKNLVILFKHTSLIPFTWDEERYRCFVCRLSIESRSELQEHTKTHGIDDLPAENISEIMIDISNVICTTCYQSFDDVDQISDHVNNNHSANYDKSTHLSLKKINLIKFSCPTCHIKFDNPHSLFHHDHSGAEINSLVNKDIGDLNMIESVKAEPEYFLIPDIQINETPDDNCFKFNDSYGQGSQNCSVENNKGAYTANYRNNEQEFNECLPGNLTNQIDTILARQNNIKEILNISTAVPFEWLNENFSCMYCYAQFEKLYEFRNHMTACHPNFHEQALHNFNYENRLKLDISNVICKLCGITPISLESLIDHSINVHHIGYHLEDECFEPYKLDGKLMECSLCLRFFKNFGELLEHTNAYHTESFVICIHCKKGFLTKKDLRSHVFAEHAKKDPFVCYTCAARVPSLSELYYHLVNSYFSRERRVCEPSQERIKNLREFLLKNDQDARLIKHLTRLPKPRSKIIKIPQTNHNVRISNFLPPDELNLLKVTAVEPSYVPEKTLLECYLEGSKITSHPTDSPQPNIKEPSKIISSKHNLLTAKSSKSGYVKKSDLNKFSTINQCPNADKLVKIPKVKKDGFASRKIMPRITCKFCQQKFMNKTGYKYHIKTNHSFKIPCQQCDVMLLDHQLKRHIRSVHSCLICDRCGKKMFNRASMLHHWEGHNKYDSKRRTNLERTQIKQKSNDLKALDNVIVMIPPEISETIRHPIRVKIEESDNLSTKVVNSVPSPSLKTDEIIKDDFKVKLEAPEVYSIKSAIRSVAANKSHSNFKCSETATHFKTLEIYKGDCQKSLVREANKEERNANISLEIVNAIKETSKLELLEGCSTNPVGSAVDSLFVTDNGLNEILNMKSKAPKEPSINSVTISSLPETDERCT